MRRIITAGLFVIFLVTVIGGGSQIQAADKYPVRPITIIIPMEVGSDADVLSRPMMQKASAILGKPVVIVNKPGGGSDDRFARSLRGEARRLYDWFGKYIHHPGQNAGLAPL